MKVFLAGILALFAMPAIADPQPSLQYFRYTRDITVSAPAQQNYFVVDADLWEHSDAQLSDIRLFDGENQVPYSLQEERGGATSEEEPIKILNLGTTGDAVQFDLDLGSVPEYDRIRLRLSAKNFISSASVEGRTALRDTHGVQLGRSTLYDFTRENLGSNSVLQIPVSSFRFLHVKLSGELQVDQVKSAYVFNVEDKKAHWVNAGHCEAAASQNSATVFNCSLPIGMPVDHIQFQIDTGAVNFRRNVTVFDASGYELASGQIERVKLARQGHTIDSEILDLNLTGVEQKQIKVTIQNGDDAPLPIQAVQPVSIERRIYFNPEGKSKLRLFVGNAKLGAPDYDYAKFFHADDNAVEAQLSALVPNAAFTGYPDDRPWSERHKIVLWMAMLLAVGVLAALTIRGFKSDVKS